MKIRTALTLKNTCVTAVFFVISIFMIYLTCEHIRSRTFFHDLKKEAITKAHLFLDNQVDAKTMQSIYLNNRKFINEVEVAVYSEDFKMLYHDAIQSDIVKETNNMLTDILNREIIEFNEDKYQVVGLLYKFKGVNYIVTAAAYDGYGYNNLNELKRALFILFFVGIIVLYWVGYILARVSLRPIKNIVKEAETISASNMDNRLSIENKKDELGELGMTINSLLERLQTSFQSQKMFVSNVSHELRTPLASLIVELELALQKQRTDEQYRQAIENVLNDAKRMTKLIDGLLNLAKADYQKEQLVMTEIRLDELMLDVRELILKSHPDYHIDLLFGEDASDDDSMITVKGNSYLLNIAFYNLIENNCKYSDNKSSFVQISFWEGTTIIRLSDSGKGLTEQDKDNLFTLFYRGGQHEGIEGYGIGMALTQKIIHLHNGKISVQSELGKGTTFIVELKHI